MRNQERQRNPVVSPNPRMRRPSTKRQTLSCSNPMSHAAPCRSSHNDTCPTPACTHTPNSGGYRSHQYLQPVVHAFMPAQAAPPPCPPTTLTATPCPPPHPCTHPPCMNAHASPQPCPPTRWILRVWRLHTHPICTPPSMRAQAVPSPCPPTRWILPQTARNQCGNYLAKRSCF